MALASVSVMLAQSRHLYVSPTGDDHADGLTPATALRTPAMALRQAREVRRLHGLSVPTRDARLTDTLFIHLSAGCYPLAETLLLRPEDSGDLGCPTVVVADHAGQAMLSGGQRVTFAPRAVPMGLGHALSVAWVAEAPRVASQRQTVRQLWMADEKIPHASLVPLDSMLPILAFRPVEREVWIPSEYAPYIDPAEAPELLLHQRWAIALLRIRTVRVGVEEVGGQRREVCKLTFHDPESRLEFEHPWPQPIVAEDRGDGRMVTSCFNVLGGATLAQPGTWYQDANTGALVYRPVVGETRSPEGIVPVLDEEVPLVAIEGQLERRVHDITFRGLTFAHSAWRRPSRLGHVTLQGGMYLLDAYKLPVAGLPEKEYLENQAWIARPEAAVRVRGGIRVHFESCNFRHLGATGLDYVWADSACHVTGCRFEDIGGTALALGAFPDGGFETHVPFRPHNMQELCCDFHIAGNVIRDATNEDWGCVGIGAGYVADCIIEDNEVSDLNYSGICVGWGWTPLNSGMRNNHIRRNYVHHFARRLYDAGGIYTLSYQPGSTIEDNRIDHIFQPLGATLDIPGLDSREVNAYATNLRGFYIYLDEATDGYTIRHNWCPDKRFGDNRPGPEVRWENNGPDAR